MKNEHNAINLLIPVSLEEQKELVSIKEQFISKIMQITDKKTYAHNLIPQIMKKLHPSTENTKELYEQLSDLKKCLDSFRPFNLDQIKYLQEVFDTRYTYASNRIEGNTLTLQETSFVINEGLTIRNKPMKDHLEAINHKEAIQFIRELVTKQSPLNEINIKLIHALILHGIDRKNAGAYRSVTVGIKGTDIIFPEPYIVPKLMEDMMFFYEENKDILYPVQLASQMHSKLVNIHPFIDGNGRTCRLVMNLILLQHGYPLTIFSPEEEDRDRYFEALNKARDKEDETPFELFVADNVKHWIIEYLSMLAPNIGEEDKNKGYYFFKKIQPYLYLN